MKKNGSRSRLVEKTIRIVIPGRLIGLNEYVAANRRNAHSGNRMREREQERCRMHMLRFRGLNLTDCFIQFHWREKNKRRDKDNVAFAKKFILDAMQDVRIIEDDDWKHVAGFQDCFHVDANNPRIEVIVSGKMEEV